MFTPIHTCKILYTIVELCIVTEQKSGALFFLFLYMYQNIIVINNAGQQRSTIFSLVSCLSTYTSNKKIQDMENSEKGVMYFFMSCYCIFVYRKTNSHVGTYMYWENIHLVHLVMFCSIFMYSSLKSQDFCLGIFRGKNLKGQYHVIFCFWFFSRISISPAPDNTIRVVSNFFENSQRYSQLQVCHRYQRHRQQIFPPFSLALLILVANLPPVSTCK
jgi:hypothetical protein